MLTSNECDLRSNRVVLGRAAIFKKVHRGFEISNNAYDNNKKAKDNHQALKDPRKVRHG